MPVQPGDLKFLKSEQISFATPAQNGGRMSTVESVSGAKGNTFPPAQEE
jgi:hypothetical protein